MTTPHFDSAFARALPDPLLAAPTAPAAPRARPTPREALAELVAGNQRFVRGEPRYGHHRPAAVAAAAEQHPNALVLGCMDSRVPLEAVFDQDFGAICVVRSGGHVLDRAVLGSVEFAVGVLRVALVLVLGHTRCGAVAATMEVARTGVRPPGELGFLVDGIAPALVGDAPMVVRDGPAVAGEYGPGMAGNAAGNRLGMAAGGLDGAEVTRAHVRRTVATLRGVAPLQREVDAGTVAMTGAVYDLETGQVTLLD